MADQRSVLERYLAATQSSNLTLRQNSLGDADQLIASGMACTAGGLSIDDKDRRMMAMEVFRMQAFGGERGVGPLVERMGRLIVKRAAFDNDRRCRTLRSMSMHEAKDVAMTVLKWRSHKACPTCHGRGHPTIGEGREVIDESRICPECHGTGEVALERLVRREYAGLARWITGEVDTLVGLVEEDMYRLLRQVRG
jgi:hypothetical protein